MKKTNKQTHKQTNKHTHKQTNKKINKQTKKQINKQTNKQTNIFFKGRGGKIRSSLSLYQISRILRNYKNGLK
jgi:hypothetical protein